MFDRGVAFTFRSHAQAYHPRGRYIRVNSLISAVALYQRLRFPALFIHFYRGFSVLVKMVLIPEMLRHFFLSRVLKDSETRESAELLHHTLHLRRAFFADFFQNNVSDNNYVFHIFKLR